MFLTTKKISTNLESSISTIRKDKEKKQKEKTGSKTWNRPAQRVWPLWAFVTRLHHASMDRVANAARVVTRYKRATAVPIKRVATG
jgi:hypothetical protein